MKCLLAVLLVGVFATSMALPARMALYQQPSFYYQARAAPQRLMYLQYVQQPSQTHARLTNSAAAFVAGETVATGTYLEGDGSDEQQIAAESVLDSTGANGAQSIAEAYPADDVLDDAEADVADSSQIAEAEAPLAPEEPEAPEIPAESQLVEEESLPVAEEQPEIAETAAAAAPEPAIAEPIAPENPEPVELPSEAVDDDEEADEDVPTVARRVPASRAGPAPLPAGTFFPIDFGGTGGGAIAIANSLSTGVSGSAKSQAIAYGRPDSTRKNARRH